MNDINLAQFFLGLILMFFGFAALTIIAIVIEAMRRGRR